MQNSYYKQQSSRARVYSFDVFDTCVTRCWHQPTDLFEGLFLALLAEQDLPSPQRETAAKALARSRTQAERTTREQTTADDITLNEIYQTLDPQLKAHNIDPTQALTEEITLELASVSPILSTRNNIQQLRKKGNTVVFISDMYLPGSVVRQMLIDQGFTDGNDDVFVSADVGLSKGSGKLFSAVCKQLNISPRQLHHTGDNRYADVRSARRMGVKATYFTQGDPTRYEQGFRPELMGSDWVRSQIIGNSRAVRLRHATADKDQRQHAMLAANLLAPLLTGYVAWVLTTAQAVGLEQLYFENEGLLVIAQTLQQQWHKRCASEHQIDQETAWATIELKKRQSPPTVHPTLSIHSNRAGYHFSLLNTIEQNQAIDLKEQDRQRDDRKYELPYINAPITLSGPIRSTAYLFQHRSLLQQLAATINSPDLPIYRTIVLDYATALTALPIAQSASRQTLDTIKRYAISNLIHLLATPTRSEVQTLTEIQKQIALPKQSIGREHAITSVGPILANEILLLLKDFVKGSIGGSNVKTTNRWMEGSLVVSSWPIRQFFYKVRSLYNMTIRARRSD